MVNYAWFDALIRHMPLRMKEDIKIEESNKKEEYSYKSLRPQFETKMEAMIWKANNNIQFNGFLIKILNMHHIVYVGLFLYLIKCFTDRHLEGEGPISILGRRLKVIASMIMPWQRQCNILVDI
ncbi:hypothetical protein CR513_13171, partial [Mucuna pruriens]